MKCRQAYSLLLAGEFLWLLLLLVTPYITARGFILPSRFLYHFFSYFCHQKPERSFFLWGEQLPVCARDCSFYVAALISTCIYPKIRGMCNPDMIPKVYLIVFLLPMAVDGGTQFLGLRESTNVLRALTGFSAGLIVPFYVIPFVLASTLPVDVKDG